MKSKTSFLITLWSVILALCLGLMLLLFAEKETRASERENRMLQGMPELTAENLLSGDFSSEMEGYLCDGFFARDMLIQYSEKLLGMFSVETVEDTALLEGGDDELQGLAGDTSDNPVENIDSETTDDAPVSNTDTEDEPVADVDTNNTSDGDSDNAEYDMYGFYFREKNGDLQMLFNTSDYTRERIAQALNKYRELLPEDGQVFYMMIPLKRNYTPVVDGDKYIGWYSSIEDGMSKYTADGVHVVNAPAILEPHLNEDIYFPLDHHWSALGAYYLCEEVITMQGLPMTPYNEYTYLKKSVYGNRFDVMYPLQEVDADRIFANTQKDAKLIDYKYDTYMIYLGGVTVPWSRYTTGFSTGRKALVIGDSFANVFAPYLTPYYDEIHMTDVRESYYDHKEAGGWIASLMKKYGIDDVYIIMSYANAANSATSYQRLEYCLYGR